MSIPEQADTEYQKMAEFFIKDEDLAVLKDKVAVITGGSSGIGLATVNLLLSLGAHVVSSDVNPSPVDHKNHAFIKANVASWSDLVALFKQTKNQHGRIDHVFANAGISGRADYLTESFTASGDLEEPPQLTFDINLRGMINTAYLGMYHMRNQSPAGGSVVCTASASSFQRFRVADYTTAKHGVLGFVRGMVPNIALRSLPIRINAIAPSWTITGLVPSAVVEALKGVSQPPEAVARSVAILMADPARQGQLIYSWASRFMEIEEGKFLPASAEVVGHLGDDGIIAALRETMADLGNSEGHNRA